jgi:uncharacterized NAD-dependent epimerase/dehydratase family protein
MSTSSPYRRLALLTQGGQDIYRNKTAMCMLRFRPDDVVCVIDAKHAGEDLHALTGAGAGIPIVATVQEAVELGIEWLVIGIATPGGRLPDELKIQVYDAIRQRVGIISGLHESISGDPNMVALAARYAVELVNLRKLPNEDFTIGKALARETTAFRVLVVGTDASIGKTTTAMELTRHLEARGIRARFVCTGQDGKLVTGRGVCIDRVISNFASGTVERLVLHEARHGDILIIEGQDAILSPPYSAVALSLLHGACPDAMVLCHAPTRTHHRHTDVAVPPLPVYRRLYEDLLAPLHPGKVVAVALNTMGLDLGQAGTALAEARKATGLPVADVLRDLPGSRGCAEVADAVLAAWEAAGGARRQAGAGREATTRPPRRRGAARRARGSGKV